MIFNAKVNISVREYYGENSIEEQFFSITADTEDEASDKIYEYLRSKSCPYGVVYDANYITFFTILA